MPLSDKGMNQAEKRLHQWWGVRVAHQAVGVDDAYKLAEIERKRLQKFHDMMLTGVPGAPPDAPAETTDEGEVEDEAMAIHVGDVTINYPEKETTEKTTIEKTDTTKAAEVPAAAPVSGWLDRIGTLGKVLLAGGLMATGGGLVAGVPLLLDALKPNAPAAAPSGVDTDTDTTYQLRLGDK